MLELTDKLINDVLVLALRDLAYLFHGFRHRETTSLPRDRNTRTFNSTKGVPVTEQQLYWSCNSRPRDTGHKPLVTSHRSQATACVPTRVAKQLGSKLNKKNTFLEIYVATAVATQPKIKKLRSNRGCVAKPLDRVHSKLLILQGTFRMINAKLRSVCHQHWAQIAGLRWTCMGLLCYYYYYCYC